jgi:hypothetical protein
MRDGSWDPLEQREPMYGVFNDQSGMYALFVLKEDAEHWVTWRTAGAPEDDRLNLDLCICEVHQVAGQIWNSYKPAPAPPPMER